METTFINPFMLFIPLTLFHFHNNLIYSGNHFPVLISEPDKSCFSNLFYCDSKSFGKVNISSFFFFLNPSQQKNIKKKKKNQHVSSKG